MQAVAWLEPSILPFASLTFIWTLPSKTLARPLTFNGEEIALDAWGLSTSIPIFLTSIVFEPASGWTRGGVNLPTGLGIGLGETKSSKVVVGVGYGSKSSFILTTCVW